MPAGRADLRRREEPVDPDDRTAAPDGLLLEQTGQVKRTRPARYVSPVSGIAATDPELVGEPYADADGHDYLPMFRQPVLVFAGSHQTLTTSFTRAVGRGLAMSIFTADLFATGNDRDNRAAVRAVPRDDLDLVGLALHGPRNAVDKVLKGAHMDP